MDNLHKRISRVHSQKKGNIFILSKIKIKPTCFLQKLTIFHGTVMWQKITHKGIGSPAVGYREAGANETELKACNQKPALYACIFRFHSSILMMQVTLRMLAKCYSYKRNKALIRFLLWSRSHGASLQRKSACHLSLGWGSQLPLLCPSSSSVSLCYVSTPPLCRRSRPGRTTARSGGATSRSDRVRN